ncbi:glycoside hydrolase domain-containing protein, partial [Okeania hirsuta]|uniref:glycoside hydrolase domain-containing protein n=1 Tax=Okeania hirsuta TaxID=1458930 RepID=UPI001960EE46
RFQHEMAGENLGAYFSFDTEENETIEVKVGVSYVSMENARENLEKEQPGFDFEGTAAASKKKWDDLLGRIELKGTKENKTKFYTALYHVLTHPSVFQDVNGEYPLMGQFGAGKVEGRNRYTVFSLWDTNRNLHPLLSLIYPEIQSEMVRSMVDIYKESGWLPKWELMGMETA